jgi:hypothetical protein
MTRLPVLPLMPPNLSGVRMRVDDDVLAMGSPRRMVKEFRRLYGCFEIASCVVTTAFHSLRVSSPGPA